MIINFKSMEKEVEDYQYNVMQQVIQIESKEKIARIFKNYIKRKKINLENQNKKE